MVSPMLWKFIDGPETLKSECEIMKSIREMFEECIGVQWIRKTGGAKYTGGLKVCGWHLIHCTLRELETTVEDAQPTQQN